jgi:hypothetical protein
MPYMLTEENVTNSAYSMYTSHRFPAQKIERQKAEGVGRRREARGMTESQGRREGGRG